MTRPLLLGPDPASPFPPAELALDEPDGLVCIGGDLSPVRLVNAYAAGLFPWFSEGQPILWWSPSERLVFRSDGVRLSKRFRRELRRRPWEVRFNTAFDRVIAACASAPRPGQDGTWITPGIVAAYSGLHRRGHAHSIEAWREGRLVGGLYGVSIGRMFFGESMFALERDASKVALAHLVAMLRARGFPLIDCQQETEHLASVGARPIPRAVFAERVARLVDSGAPRDPWEPPAVEDVLA